MHPLETYLQDLSAIRASGAAVPETSGYGALAALLNAVGGTLKPKVRCIINLQNQGAGLPDGGFFTADQFQKHASAETLPGQLPSRGAIEVKAVIADLEQTAASEQVAKYLAKYNQVLLTNYREFLLVGQGPDGKPVHGERYRLAESAAAFWAAASHPHKTANAQGERLAEYLQRVMRHAAPLTSPADVAWFLASYARDAHARIDAQAGLPALAALRAAMENALGMTFQGAEGEHFFRSTLVQTLFYGVFAAWVLWHKENPARADKFDWRLAAYYLNVPVIQALFQQVAGPSQLKALGLIEPLDWAGAALSRVTRTAFFAKFEEAHAVQYFYEPFLQAYDPELRKQLGVWYTPPEIIRYMVARVDAVLRTELGVADGLADNDVYVLDPCCGTGGFLVETLAHIAQTLVANGEEGLLAAKLKQAATHRLFGFEILPAPLVIAHMQIGLALSRGGAPLAEGERAGVYLTNALTGWEPPDPQKEKAFQQLLIPFPELAHERDAAREVKHHDKILVVLGNPPYNGFAGVSPEEEGGLVEPYKAGLITEWGIKKFNLDDLYIRFFRLAERRIAEMTGRGVVCYISNFSYLGDPSFVVMRRRFLAGFDVFWFDCLNGDSRETGKLTPDGKPDPSIFSTEWNREGIRVGTAIGLMVRKIQRSNEPAVRFRQFWGINKRADLLASLANTETFEVSETSKVSVPIYAIVQPDPSNRYSFRPSEATALYLAWPSLVELCAEPPNNGLMEKRGGALMDMDREALERRMRMYYDPAVDWEILKALGTGLTENATGFEAGKVRGKVQIAEEYQPMRVRRYALRPFETRWCYYSDVSPLWNRARSTLVAQCWDGNAFLMSRPAGVAIPEGTPYFFTTLLGDNDFLRGHAYYFPLRLRSVQANKPAQPGFFAAEPATTANLSPAARAYLAALGIPNPDDDADIAPGLRAYELIWLHALAIGYSPAYLSENADGIRGDWPRIPLPASRDALLASAALGRQVAVLLDTERPVPGVTHSPVRSELKPVAVLARVGGGSLDPAAGDLDITAGWGHAGKEGITMPGKGRIMERQGGLLDVHLNDLAYWRDVPTRTWDYTIGGYQVIKKWLSYRERSLLGRGLTIEEAQEVTHMARRITAILLLEPALDANYRAVAGAAYAWGRNTR